MRKFDFEKRLHQILKKLFKKDKKRYETVFKKIDEIINSSDIEHYKNFRRHLNKFKRVHVDSSFVLVFQYDKINDKVLFYDFDHHDKIYKNKLFLI